MNTIHSSNINKKPGDALTLPVSKFLISSCQFLMTNG